MSVFNRILAASQQWLRGEATKSRRIRLSVEGLEARDVPAVYIESEPAILPSPHTNDTFQTAEPLDISGPGTFEITGSHPFVAQNGNLDIDTDFYSFPLFSGQEIRVTLISQAQTFPLTLYGQNGEIVGSGFSSLTATALESGIYRLEVYSGDWIYGANYHFLTGEPYSFDFPYSVSVNLTGSAPDLAVDAASWNASIGGCDFSFTVQGNLQEQTTAQVYWAKGDTYADRLGAPVYEQIIDPYDRGPSPIRYQFHIPGSLLKKAPDGTTHLILVLDSGNTIREVSDDNNVKELRDVQIAYANGIRELLSPKTIEVIKDALRYAGEDSGLISSTFRTPEEQAHAMFVNVNLYGFKSQYDLYGAGGDQVIRAYERALEKYKKEIAKAQKKGSPVPKPVDYEAIMTAEIYKVGPQKVSKHCFYPTQLAEYEKYQTFDIDPGSIVNQGLFHDALTSDSRIAKVLDMYTKKKDPAFHIEVPQ